MTKLKVALLLLISSVGAIKAYAACDYASCGGGHAWCCTSSDGSDYYKDGPGK